MRSQFIELQIILEIVAQIVVIMENAFPKSRTLFVLQSFYLYFQLIQAIL